VLYVGSQILIWIVLAALLGFGLGWMVRGRRGARVKRRRRF
jgi:predicted permease